jgi:hypothetical protein
MNRDPGRLRPRARRQYLAEASAVWFEAADRPYFAGLDQSAERVEGCRRIDASHVVEADVIMRNRGSEFSAAGMMPYDSSAPSRPQHKRLPQLMERRVCPQ